MKRYLSLCLAALLVLALLPTMALAATEYPVGQKKIWPKPFKKHRAAIPSN